MFGDRFEVDRETPELRGGGEALHLRKQAVDATQRRWRATQRCGQRRGDADGGGRGCVNGGQRRRSGAHDVVQRRDAGRQRLGLGSERSRDLVVMGDDLGERRRSRPELRGDVTPADDQPGQVARARALHFLCERSDGRIPGRERADRAPQSAISGDAVVGRLRVRREGAEPFCHRRDAREERLSRRELERPEDLIELDRGRRLGVRQERAGRKHSRVAGSGIELQVPSALEGESRHQCDGCVGVDRHSVRVDAHRHVGAVARAFDLRDLPHLNARDANGVPRAEPVRRAELRAHEEPAARSRAGEHPHRHGRQRRERNRCRQEVATTCRRGALPSLHRPGLLVARRPAACARARTPGGGSVERVLAPLPLGSLGGASL